MQVAAMEIERAADAPTTPAEIAQTLGPRFAERAADHDADRYIADNIADLKAAGLVEAGVPRELGGGGADVDALAAMLRTLGYHCGSTGLAFSMHTHQVAIPAWRWRHRQLTAAEPLLKRVAAERLLLLSSGGSDWLDGTGTAVKVDGGYRIDARKVFTSGAPTGNLLMTGAVYAPPGEPPVVLHFGIPMSSPHVRIEDTWRVLGMRGTGSHDVTIDGHVVPDAAVAGQRKAGEWGPLFQIIATIAFPLIYSAYFGVAERARDLAIGLARRKSGARHATAIAGRMDTELAGARMALDAMLAVVRENAPSASSVNRVMIGKRLLTAHALAAVDAAMELAGGAGFYRATGLERCFRDIQAARYHPLRADTQAEYAGAMALGLPVDKIF